MCFDPRCFFSNKASHLGLSALFCHAFLSSHVEQTQELSVLAAQPAPLLHPSPGPLQSVAYQHCRTFTKLHPGGNGSSLKPVLHSTSVKLRNRKDLTVIQLNALCLHLVYPRKLASQTDEDRQGCQQQPQLFSCRSLGACTLGVPWSAMVAVPGSFPLAGVAAHCSGEPGCHSLWGRHWMWVTHTEERTSPHPRPSVTLPRLHPLPARCTSLILAFLAEKSVLSPCWETASCAISPSAQ